MLDDLGDGLRMVARRPGTTVVAVFILTLGLGAATAIFSVVDAVLLRPLPYVDAERVVVIWQSDRTRNRGSLLYRVNARDPLTFVTASILVAAVVAVACGLPVLRAIRVEPAVALRAE